MKSVEKKDFTKKILQEAELFVRNRRSKIDDFELERGSEYLDWAEESGWNDVYGSDVDASDIIEFRD